jgi:hypothetical protein
MLKLLPVRAECSGLEGITFLTYYRKSQAQRETKPAPMLNPLPVRMGCSGREGITFLTHNQEIDDDLIKF